MIKKGEFLDGGENVEGVGGGGGRGYDHPINQRCLFQKSCTHNRMKTHGVQNGVYFTQHFTTPGLNMLLQLLSVLPIPLLQ